MTIPVYETHIEKKVSEAVHRAMLLAKMEIMGGVRIDLMDGLSIVSTIFSLAAEISLQTSTVSESFGEEIVP